MLYLAGSSMRGASARTAISLRVGCGRRWSGRRFIVWNSCSVEVVLAIIFETTEGMVELRSSAFKHSRVDRSLSNVSGSLSSILPFKLSARVSIRFSADARIATETWDASNLHGPSGSFGMESPESSNESKDDRSCLISFRLDAHPKLCAGEVGSITKRRTTPARKAFASGTILPASLVHSIISPADNIPLMRSSIERIGVSEIICPSNKSAGVTTLCRMSVTGKIR
mmetsp:Transcript_5220/g.8078  ORF Transcript_5220/g.8078 Transcript_5220/m.8078 type:complete len:227 (+) Transcript_5220:1282-1962(+)